MTSFLRIGLGLALCACSPTLAQDSTSDMDAVTVKAEGRPGSAHYLSERAKESHDRWGFAGAYRAGDYVYLSGVVIGARDGEPLDDEQFKESARRAFRVADLQFKAAGASIADVIDITSFHVWGSPLFPAGKLEHLDALAAVKREFISAPDPAWTAVGTTELLPQGGIVEMRMVAYSPGTHE